jgi:hypothetical protein
MFGTELHVLTTENVYVILVNTFSAKGFLKIIP